MILDYIINTVASANPVHGKKLKKNIECMDTLYFQRAEAFLIKYEHNLKKNNKSIDYAIECYLKMLADINYETLQFFRNGTYSNTSFEAVRKEVYERSNIMSYYIHGLILRQFLFTQNYKCLMFFKDFLNTSKKTVNNYLEVGGGHGLFLSEAMQVFKNETHYTMVDISQTSLDLASSFIGNYPVDFVLNDIQKYCPPKKFDFICMGEVLEHVETPVQLLIDLSEMLDKGGKLFITTVTNAPAIDHIYLFKDKQDILQVITKAGFEIEKELFLCSEDMPSDKAEKLKAAMIYAAFLKQIKK